MKRGKTAIKDMEIYIYNKIDTVSDKKHQRKDNSDNDQYNVIILTESKQLVCGSWVPIKHHDNSSEILGMILQINKKKEIK